MPLFVFSMVLQVWIIGSGDGYLLWGTVPLQEGHFFVYRGFFRACSWGCVCRVLVLVSSGQFDGVASFVLDLLFVPYCVSCIVRQLLCIFISNMVCKS